MPSTIRFTTTALEDKRSLLTQMIIAKIRRRCHHLNSSRSDLLQNERQALIVCLVTELDQKRSLTHEFDSGGFFRLIIEAVSENIKDEPQRRLLLADLLDIFAQQFLNEIRTKEEEKQAQAA